MINGEILDENATSKYESISVFVFTEKYRKDIKGRDKMIMTEAKVRDGKSLLLYLLIDRHDRILRALPKKIYVINHGSLPKILFG